MTKRKKKDCYNGTFDLLGFPPDLRQVRLDEIDPRYHEWEVWRSAPDADVTDLTDASRKCQYQEPLRLVPHDGRLTIVTGRLQYEAAVRLRAGGGTDQVAAAILPAMTTTDLLCTAIMANELRHQSTTIELGWALSRLRRSLERERSGDTEGSGGGSRQSRRRAIRHRELAETLGLNYVRYKTRLSEGLRYARLFPEEDAEALAQKHGCSISDIVGQNRRVWRLLKKADPALLPELRACIAAFIASGVPVEPGLQTVLAREAAAGGAAVPDDRAMTAVEAVALATADTDVVAAGVHLTAPDQSTESADPRAGESGPAASGDVPLPTSETSRPEEGRESVGSTEPVTGRSSWLESLKEFWTSVRSYVMRPFRAPVARIRAILGLAAVER